MFYNIKRVKAYAELLTWLPAALKYINVLPDKTSEEAEARLVLQVRQRYCREAARRSCGSEDYPVVGGVNAENELGGEYKNHVQVVNPHALRSQAGAQACAVVHGQA